MLQGKKWRKFSDYLSAIEFMERDRYTANKYITSGYSLCSGYDMKMYQPCLRQTSLLKQGVKNIIFLNHYTITDCGRNMQAYCLRERKNGVVVTTHLVGECPLCVYEDGWTGAKR